MVSMIHDELMSEEIEVEIPLAAGEWVAEVEIDPNADDDLESRIGYHFHNRDILESALTHPSCGGIANYERLEFLGDAVLGLVVGENLFRRHPQADEGVLTEERTRLVRQRTLARAAKILGLQDDIARQRCVGRGGELPDSVFANVFEALTAAVYLDGGLEAAENFIKHTLFTNKLHKFLHEEANQSWEEVNWKAKLQEAVQRVGLPQPRYYVIEESGPSHARHFLMAVRIGNDEWGRGHGPNKKTAQQSAAQQAVITHLDAEPRPDINDDAELTVDRSSNEVEVDIPE